MAWAFRLAGRAAAGLASASLVGIGVTGIYTSRVVNSPRSRDFTERFHLTPEELRMPYTSDTVVTADDIALRGWHVQQTRDGQPSDRVIVVFHPYNTHKSNMLGMVRAFWDSGYSVYLADFRSFAERPTRQSLGFYERRDAGAVLRHVRKMYGGSAKLGVVGASMGGAMALTTSFSDEGRECDVGAVASDCAFCDLSDVLRNQIRQLGLPAPAAEASLAVCKTFNKVWYGYSLDGVRPIDAVGDVRHVVSRDAGDGEGGKNGEGGKYDSDGPPCLIIHSANDGIVPLSHGRRLFEAAKSKDKRLWIVPETEHLGAYFASRAEYSRRLVSFFDEVM